MALPSHAGDSATEATWSWRDVDAKSCWRWCCRADLAMMQCRCRVMLVMGLPSHVGDDAAGETWPLRNVDAESC
jgi:hypothetical protein